MESRRNENLGSVLNSRIGGNTAVKYPAVWLPRRMLIHPTITTTHVIALHSFSGTA